MKSLRLVILPLLVIVACINAQETPPLKTFHLYKADKTCSCIRAKKETPTTITTELRVGSDQYQVFWSRTEPKTELFRVEIGSYIRGQGLVKVWDYGVSDEGDFNGDGLPDYAWYGGDDTGYDMFLFLSSPSGYQRVDIIKTIESAWTHRFNKQAPDLGSVDGIFQIDDVSLEHSQTGLVLSSVVNHLRYDGEAIAKNQFRINQSDFIP